MHIDYSAKSRKPTSADDRGPPGASTWVSARRRRGARNSGGAESHRTLRGPLHGIPVALKDNIFTKGLRTTVGALVFSDLVPPFDATFTANLRAAGAIIMAKTQLTELANWMATGMPGNYNGLNG